MPTFAIHIRVILQFTLMSDDFVNLTLFPWSEGLTSLGIVQSLAGRHARTASLKRACGTSCSSSITSFSASLSPRISICIIVQLFSNPPSSNNDIILLDMVNILSDLRSSKMLQLQAHRRLWVYHYDVFLHRFEHTLLPESTLWMTYLTFYAQHTDRSKSSHKMPKGIPAVSRPGVKSDQDPLSRQLVRLTRFYPYPRYALLCRREEVTSSSYK